MIQSQRQDLEAAWTEHAGLIKPTAAQQNEAAEEVSACILLTRVLCSVSEHTRQQAVVEMKGYVLHIFDCGTAEKGKKKRKWWTTCDKSEANKTLRRKFSLLEYTHTHIHTHTRTHTRTHTYTHTQLTHTVVSVHAWSTFWLAGKVSLYDELASGVFKGFSGNRSDFLPNDSHFHGANVLNFIFSPKEDRIQGLKSCQR